MVAANETSPHDVRDSLRFHKPFRRAAVLGAGVMGSQIAAHLANAGVEVLLLDIASPKGPKNAIVQGALKRLHKLKPAPLMSARNARLIEVGNFDDDLPKIASAEWIIEVVVERLDIKRDLMQRVEEHAAPEAVISTNTSGLPIQQIAQGRSEAFRRRFLGTHFFNPPRYLRLFEMIPTGDTDPAIVERVAHFARVRLGKGVVIAKDTPNFIGNRIGVYAMNRAMLDMIEGDYSIEEIDLLTGTLVGHPKSATFRTADVVGLDTMIHVSRNLYDAVPDDESRDVFKVPDLVQRLVDSGALGAKAGRGFYRKVGRNILSVDRETLDYQEPREFDLGNLSDLKKIAPLKKRLQALYQDPGRAGRFFRGNTLDSLAYAARRLPEISDNPADVDRAVRWGFGWEMGPFQIWDALGFEQVLGDMKKKEIPLPPWVEEMRKAGAESFYRYGQNGRQVYLPGTGFVGDEEPADEIQLAPLKSDSNTIWENDEAALLDLGQGVTLFEFRSKANTLGSQVMSGLRQALSIVEDGDWSGMVIGNQGRNFSVGANLGEVAMAAQQGQFDLIAQAVQSFQETIQRVRYSSKPVVAALHSQVLGGACELSMACSQVVAAAETYIGLVELGAGVIPGGTGTCTLAARAAENAAQELPSQVQEFLARSFLAVGQAKVATSAQEAVETGYLLPSVRIVMNGERRLFTAREEVLRMALQGYAPPPVRKAIYVLGRPARAAFELAARGMMQAGWASEYDKYLADRLAYVMTGGDLSGPAHVHEDYLIRLERETFLSLLGQTKTQERIAHILTQGKPLRN